MIVASSFAGARTIAIDIDEAIKSANQSATQQQFLTGLEGVPLTFEPHLIFKKRVPAAIGLIRTGDTTPYANMILESA